ncbi:MFS general substrate transporter [Apiospora marii]|uniref:MFS general substrate transporter n=1 Tax=Apiospora marii TaxID=335849 RepID=A0ABR1R3Z8_9PEZI
MIAQPIPSPQLSAAPRPKKPLSFHLSIFKLALILPLVSWNSTTLAVATPTITNHLHVSTLEPFWASIAFILGVVVTQPIYSNISNVFGRRVPLLLAILSFTVGSVVFGVANSMPVVIAGRLLQGLGGGGLNVLQAIILSDVTTLRERPL